jgi:hypothetical protein
VQLHEHSALPEGKSLSSYMIRDRLGSRVGLDAMEKREIFYYYILSFHIELIVPTFRLNVLLPS